LNKIGHDVQLGALYVRTTPSSDETRVDSIPFWNASKLHNYLEGFEVIHSQHPLANYLSLASDKPLIYHYHGVPAGGRGKVYSLSAVISLRATGSKIRAAIACSKSGKREILRLLDHCPAFMIHNGVDTRIFRLGLEAKERRGEPQLLFVGNLYRHKRVDELLDGLKQVLQTYPGAHLCIVGQGALRSDLERKADKLGVSAHVRFAGFVPMNLMPYFYSSADVYLSASRYESYPLPLLEAWAVGKPVVVTAISAHVEMLGECGAGCVYEPGNLENLAERVTDVFERRRELQTKALSYAESHSWSAMAGRIAGVYSQVGV
jgi:glycosyltransferase involved in cell wall biosynthesis